MKNDIINRLKKIKKRCEDALKVFIEPLISKYIDDLYDAISKISQSWSGSWLGYQAYVYYKDFKPPKPGDHFNIEWGFYRDQLFEPVSDNWVEVIYDDVLNEVLNRAGKQSITLLEEQAEEPKREFKNSKDEFNTITEILLSEKSDKFVENVHKDSLELRVLNQAVVIRGLQPTGQYATRDTLAATQGLKTPPHISLEAWLISIKSVKSALENLIRLIKKMITYFEQKRDRKKVIIASNGKIFIGHGHSKIWKDLKDFLQDRLGLAWDEFNREPVAGISTVDRLQRMLSESVFAFMIMTAEDEHIDGKLHARENVVHEAGLFQGRLGFKKAIILLEEGCIEFSNITGLGYIKFPKGKIDAKFEEIRRVLEREKIIESK